MVELNMNSVGMHQDLVDQMLDTVWKIPADRVSAPDLPIMTYISEGLGFVAAARENFQDLNAVAMPETLIPEAEQRLFALFTIQAQWNKERNKGRDERIVQLIDKAYDLRADCLAMADLALRNSAEGRRRLSAIREGEGLADLVADLNDLALLIRDAEQLFASINIDAKMQADTAEQVCAQLQNTLAKEKAHQSTMMTKELRDRFYTYSLEPLKEIRAFAHFAFRNDKGNSRKQAFSSMYNRRQVRKYRHQADMLRELGTSAVTE